jgi:hypothetical protein
LHPTCHSLLKGCAPDGPWEAGCLPLLLLPPLWLPLLHPQPLLLLLLLVVVAAAAAAADDHPHPLLRAPVLLLLLVAPHET